MTAPSSLANAPIGIFDSGVGGLSVLRHIRAQLPHEHLLYFADSGFAPYGGKPEQVVAERSLAIAGFLVAQGAKALVVACNTATIAAIKLLRQHYPDMPIVGVEPGLKPAAAATRSGVVGVMATERTLTGEKFLLLRDQISQASNAKFVLQPCHGLVDQIELGELDTDATTALLARYIAPLLEQGADTLVLGCTHYPLLTGVLSYVMGDSVTLVSSAEETAKDVYGLLVREGLERDRSLPAPQHGFLTTGRPEEFASLARRFLGPEVETAKQFSWVGAV
jgi:glutamate racemase